MRDRREFAVRIGLAYLALVLLETGLWAIVDPQGFFRNYPGIGSSHWVAADPPYNHHLLIDAGAGFLAVGIVVALAVFWSDRRVRQLALIAYLAEGLPHFAFHVLHPADALGTGDRIVSTGGLGFGCALAVLLLVVVSRDRAASVSGD